MQPTVSFLTPEECAEVDKALMTTHDKFTARVAIYALRSLKQIAQQTNTPIEALETAQIEAWIHQDASLQQGMDQEFRKFFSQLVLASRKPLVQAGQAAGVEIEDLTIPQVITWFEQEAKRKQQ